LRREALKALLCSARAKEQRALERERERETQRDPERAEWSLLLTVVTKDFDQRK
jgi:hypothetical protein